jgi:hypothetical protein
LSTKLADLISKTEPITKFTGNWADYSTCKPYVCCGWMDYHIDDDYSGTSRSDPYFSITPKYWHKDAVLLVTNKNNKIVKVPRTLEKTITFNARKVHGLYPKHIAKVILKEQTWKVKDVQLFDKLIKDTIFFPKLVWEFSEERGKIF